MMGAVEEDDDDNQELTKSSGEVPVAVPYMQMTAKR